MVRRLSSKGYTCSGVLNKRMLRFSDASQSFQKAISSYKAASDIDNENRKYWLDKCAKEIKEYFITTEYRSDVEP